MRTGGVFRGVLEDCHRVAPNLDLLIGENVLRLDAKPPGGGDSNLRVAIGMQSRAWLAGAGLVRSGSGATMWTHRLGYES